MGHQSIHLTLKQILRFSGQLPRYWVFDRLNTVQIGSPIITPINSNINIGSNTCHRQADRVRKVAPEHVWTDNSSDAFRFFSKLSLIGLPMERVT